MRDKSFLDYDALRLSSVNISNNSPGTTFVHPDAAEPHEQLLHQILGCRS